MGDVRKYVWCEDSSSGYIFWNVIFNTLYPDYIVETKNGNSHLNKAIEKISDNGNLYYIIIDTAADNPDVLRELMRLKRSIAGKNNIRLIKVHSFEFALLSFEFFEQWMFSENDDLREKRRKILEAKDQFVKLINYGGNAEDLSEFKSACHFQSKMNTEKISARILSDITRNTGFETNKKQIGPCFIKSCCEWNERQEDDICGLDNNRLEISVKLEQILKYSVLQSAFEEAGIK